MVICLERCADLHVAQLMPLPLTVSCFSKIQIGFTFLVPAHPGSPGQGAVKRVCVLLTSVVCLCVCLFVDDCEPCKNGWIGWGAIWGVHWWGWRNHVLDGGMNPPWDGALLSRHTWTCLAVYILRLTRRAAARGDVVCMPLLPWPLVDFDVT